MYYHNYEGVSFDITLKINNYLNKLNSNKKLTTEKEREYLFFTFLNKLDLTNKQKFDIYTNTKLA